MKEEIKSHWRTWAFYATIGLVLIIVYKLLDGFSDFLFGIKELISIISPFLVGILLAYLLYIPEHKIENIFKKSKNRVARRNARKIGIFFTYIIVLLCLIIIINFIFPVLIKSVNELIGNVPVYYTKVINSYNNLPDDSIFKTEQVFNALKELQNFDLKQYVSIEKITSYIKGAVGVARGIFDIFVAIVVSIYILSERNEILSFLKRFTKSSFNEKTSSFIEKNFYRSNGVFFKFISSQFIDAVIVGIISTIVLNILKIKYASLLGFGIGLFNMIPYFGAIIAIGFAAFITLITAGISKTVLMLIIIVMLQQIDANVINPKIIGDSLKISPLLVILAVTIGGGYFGIVGMFLGVPIAAVLKIMVNDYIDRKV